MATGFRLRAVSSTYCSRGLPARGCSTFGRADFMRLPAPAARMMTTRGGAVLAPERVKADFLVATCASMSCRGLGGLGGAAAGRCRVQLRESRLHLGADKQPRI